MRYTRNRQLNEARKLKGRKPVKSPSRSNASIDYIRTKSSYMRGFLDPSFEWLRKSGNDVREITENNILLFDIKDDRFVTLRAKGDKDPLIADSVFRKLARAIALS